MGTLSFRSTCVALSALSLAFVVACEGETPSDATPEAAPEPAAEIVEYELPAGVKAPPAPAGNPPSAEKIALGRKLYFDARISTDGTISCASCHNPKQGWADGRGTSTSAGVGGQLGGRNAPTVLNAAFFQDQFWDGRAQFVEGQAVMPLSNPIEHGFKNDAEVLAKLNSLTDYAPLFEAAFGDSEITIERVGQAIGSFERTIISLDAPIDRYIAGDADAISESAKRGWALYNGKALCVTCHMHNPAKPIFSDEQYHNLGVATHRVDFDALVQRVTEGIESGKTVAELGLEGAEADELGRFMVTGNLRDMGAFKTPLLRNIALTGPYMHDGSESTLEEVIEFYNRGGNKNPALDPLMRPLGLNEQEIADLVAVMETFTSDDLDRFKDLELLAP